MKIYIKSATQGNMSASQQVNRLGKYLYKHLDGAYKYMKSGNMYDVYCTLLYQLKPECGGKVNDVQEMTININITTYQNKIRINTIEMTPEERTLGYDTMKPEEMSDLKQAMEIIIWKVGNKIRKAYKDYLILF
ncbi:MAG: hypothetical protein NC320_01685 [Clostridium sp.]|nr:hypothetical protein [Clostridium sp.]